MPEGHTIHALAKRLDAAFEGTAPRVSSPQGRFVEEAAILDGLEYDGASALGKHLTIRFRDDAERVVHVHLGLFGKFSVKQHRRKLPDGGLDELEVPVAGQVRMRLLSETHVADLRGPTACELLDEQAWAAKATRIGADPLARKTLPADTMRRILRSNRPVGALLMDQSLISGVGNVYRAELLHRLRLDPYLPGRELTEGVVQRLWEELVRLMPYGVETGRILVDDRDVRRAATLLREGRSGRIRPTYAVYRRHGKECPRCGGIVQKETMVARNLYWCSRCQVGLPDLDDPALEVLLADRVRETVAARPSGSVCPSEVSRAVAEEIGTPGWRDLMPLVREAAVRLAKDGEITLRRKGEPLDPSDLGKGPIRLGP